MDDTSVIRAWWHFLRWESYVSLESIHVVLIEMEGNALCSDISGHCCFGLFLILAEDVLIRRLHGLVPISVMAIYLLDNISLAGHLPCQWFPSPDGCPGTV